MIFSITLLACDTRAIVRLCEDILESPFLVLVHRLTPSIFLARPFLSKFDGILLLTPLFASSPTSFNSSMGIPSEPGDFPFACGF